MLNSRKINHKSQDRMKIRMNKISSYDNENYCMCESNLINEKHKNNPTKSF